MGRKQDNTTQKCNKGSGDQIATLLNAINTSLAKRFELICKTNFLPCFAMYSNKS